MGAWWAALSGVAQSRTQLKRLRTVVQGANGVQVSSEHRLELCFHLGTAAVVVPPQHTSALNLIFSHQKRQPNIEMDTHNTKKEDNGLYKQRWVLILG